jgi:hypothetical protein
MTAALMARFEAAMLGSLGLEVSDLDFPSLGRRYLRLSEALGPGHAAASSTLLRDPLDVLVFGLVYAARTFHVAHRLLVAMPPAAGPIIDLGAGLGPFGLAASLLLHRPVTLVEREAFILEHARSLFHAAGAQVPDLVALDIEHHRPAGAAALLLGFVAGEIDGPPWERWVRGLAPDGRLYIVEPGTGAQARALQALRDAPPGGASVLAPCMGVARCPLTPSPQDWCHFTWRIPLGPIGRAVADHARRRWREQHFSFCVLGSGAPLAGLRVLSVRPHGASKVVAMTCGPAGLVPLTALRRDRPAYDAISNLEPGTAIEVSSQDARGDGLRIHEPDELTTLAEI